MLYFDHAATSPVDKRVLKKMLPYFSDDFANPSSLYSPALKAKKAVDEARKQVADFLNCRSDEVIFTSGGTESDNLAIFGIARAHLASFRTRAGIQKNDMDPRSGLRPVEDDGHAGHIITTQIEHPAVLNVYKQLEKEGFEATYLPVDKDGIVHVKDVKKALQKNTILVSIMYANNEIGTVQPIAEIAKIIRDFRKNKCHFERSKKSQRDLSTSLCSARDDSYEKTPFFHSDACQAAGYLDMDVQKLGVDLLTINGSKIYGPKGIGALYINGSTIAHHGQSPKTNPIIFGGGQEWGLRSGTENVPAIVGLGAAITLLNEKLKMKNEKFLRDYIIRELLKIPNSRLNGHRTKRLPNNINISFDGVEGESLVLYLDRDKIYTSTGSACSTKSLEPSRVIMALTHDAERAHSSLRVTLGRSTTKKQADKLISATKKYVEKLREMSAVK